MEKLVDSSCQEISLNVSGTIIKTSKEILTSEKGSSLEAMFSERHELTLVNDIPIIERDPETFKNLLFVLKNDRFMPPNLRSMQQKKLRDEMEFWGIHPKLRIPPTPKQLEI